MSQDPQQHLEPSVLDYARFYGLTYDHRQLSPPLQGLTPPENWESLLDDPPELFHIRLTDFKVPKERLTLDKGAAALLSSITESAKRPPTPSDEDLGFDRQGVGRRLKQELPLLRSDHEIDVLRFKSPIVPDVGNEFLPFETIDSEEDEGLEWPSTFRALPDKFFDEVKSEKIGASKDDFLYLQEMVDCHLEGTGFEVDDLSYKRTTVPDRVSPPLLPMSPSPEPYIPSSETGRLDFLSDPDSPTREEAREVERMIFAEDGILPIKKQDNSASQISDPMLLETESLGDLYSPLKGIKDPLSSPSPIRLRSKDFKVEVPLSPPRSDPLPPWKRKNVLLSEVMPDLIHELPLPLAKPEDISSDDVDALLEEIIKPVAVKAERAIEQEQLQEADTVLRVQVPTMDFSLPIPPWKAKSHATKADNEENSLKDYLTEMKALHFSNHSWPINGQAERALKWAPFPVALGKVDIQESIPDNGEVEKYIEPPECVDTATLTWKPDGLRIFDELAESDEELEEGDFPDENDISSLIRKRKLELEEEEEEEKEENRAPLSENFSNAANARLQSKEDSDASVTEIKRITETPTRETAIKSRHQRDFLSTSFLDMNTLEDYMNVRKGQLPRRKVVSDHHIAKLPLYSQPPESADPHPFEGVFPVNLQTSSPHTHVLPSPLLSFPSSPRWFIISASSFLSSRRLFRHVQRLYPAADFIERDFTLHQQHEARRRPQSKASAMDMSLVTMTDEADILLSPSTGLIWTSLQKIKQRSLPGQVYRSAIRERIYRTSTRYERLLVLISQNRDTDPSVDSVGIDVQNLEDDDSIALAEFAAFCSTLPDEVQTSFVAGGEEDLAKWIVAAMVTHGMNPDQEIKLLQEETLWEVFLRRVGINAFAAQAILVTLKAPDQDDVNAAGMPGTEFGLTAFIKMSVEERLARFETLLGGRRLLERASSVVDARW